MSGFEGGWDASLVNTASSQTITGVKHFSVQQFFDSDAVFDAPAPFAAGNPTTTLNGAIDGVVTSIVVAAGFAVSSGFVVLIDFEKMLVTAGGTTTTWTVTRAYGNTQPATHANAATVTQVQLVSIGVGDDVWYALGGRGFAQVADFRQGSAASPNTWGLGPTLKVSRSDSIPEANMPLGGGANFMGNGAIWGSAAGDVNNQASVNAVIGTAINFSTQNTHNDDAQGITGVGRVDGSGTGYGIGAYLKGQRNTTAGGTNALEVRSSNLVAQDDPYMPTTASKTMGVWATADGAAPSAVAFAAGTFGSSQPWHVGFAATSGSVDQQAFRDDSSSDTSLLINGTHASAAIAVKSGSGPVLIGELTAQSATSLFEVFATASKDPIARWGSTGAADSHSLRLNNGSGTLYLAFVCGGSNLFLTGTVAGDTGVKVFTAAKSYHIGGTTRVVTVTGGNLLGFYAVAPVAQAAAITAPTAPSAAYVQAEATAMKTAVDAIRVALTNIGITL